MASDSGLQLDQAIVNLGFATAEQVGAARKALAEAGEEPTPEKLLSQMVQDGTLTQEQAQQAREQLDAASNTPKICATCAACGHQVMVKEDDVLPACPKCQGELAYDERTIRLADAPPRDPLIEQVLKGRYQIAERVGMGGFGAVYRATGAGDQTQSVLEYAVKILHPHFCDQPDAVNEFFGEASKLAMLGHPAVVTVVDTGWHEGRPFIVMEFIRGLSLSALLRETGGKLDVPTALRVTAQVAGVVASAHDAGLIHRDIKPANVMVLGETDVTTAQVKVLDFGIAKLQDEMTGDKLTIAGTEGYQAPEQAEGHPTPSSDV